MKRWEAVEKIVPLTEGALVITCNGMLGRDVHATGDRPDRFYMIGSMGLAGPIGLGLAIARPEKRVVVLDGDGNVLMGMGALANVGAIQPGNYYHFIFDNGVHASTGGQKTIARTLQLEEVARVCGYPKVLRAESLDEVEDKAREMLSGPGPACLLLQVEPGNQSDIPRVEATPREMADRMRLAATGEQP